MMKKWEAKLPGGKKIVFESDTPREYMRYVGHDEYALTQIAQVPSANVSQVRHGRWLDVQETDMYVPNLKLTATKTAETCSECKARIGFIGQKLYLFDSFCPSCGAKMDGGHYG